ncbi:hypothetical protein EDB87DRAFT_1594631 [Lactarius vividus]|nr:hypothetical protein EDB87DRAFT_1594631 [Lactarius vividus]
MTRRRGGSLSLRDGCIDFTLFLCFGRCFGLSDMGAAGETSQTTETGVNDANTLIDSETCYSVGSNLCHSMHIFMVIQTVIIS